jgi:hypothetical protein
MVRVLSILSSQFVVQIAVQTKTLKTAAALTVLVLGIAACGGDDTGGPTPTPTITPTVTPTVTPTPTPDPDGTPADFSFTAESDAALNTLLTSDEFTVDDINTPVAITITGGEYALDGGDFTSAAGTVVNGQTIQVQTTSSAEFSTATVVSLTVGGISADFTVTTLAQDLTPEVITFTDMNDRPLNATAESITATVTGINDAAPISIVGGEYAIGAGDYTSAAGTINEGDTVKVSVTTSSAFSTPVVATLTIGGVEATFTATTLAQDITPEAFTFTDMNDRPLDAITESTTATVTGINAPAPISIVGGEYAIGAGDYTGEAGIINEGDTVKISVTAASTFSTSVVATLTIGDIESTFTATTLAQDITPDAFAFTAQTDVALSDLLQSTTITISGINDATAITVANGEYAIGVGAYTSEAGMVVNGDTVKVQQTSSAEFSTASSVVLTVGGVVGTYTVTTLAQDITPDTFSFVSQTDVPVGDNATSNTVTIAGINDNAVVTITNGLYAIGDSGSYTAAAGSVANGQTLTVQVTASGEFSTDTVATLTVGTETATFTATTEAQDIIPDGFFFTDASDVALSTLSSSDTLSISGLNDEADITIVGGSYSINSDVGFVSTAGKINDGDTVQVQATSSASPATSVDVVLTIGGVSDTFTITTTSDTTAPTATIVFPPPSSMTEGSTVTVRGTATDDLGAVTSVVVNGVDVTDTSGDGSFATWQVVVPLAAGENTITVVVEDEVANVDSDAASVAVRQDVTLADFPDSINPLSRPTSFAIDYSRNRALIGDRELDVILTMDLATGERGILSDNTKEDTGTPYVAIEGLLVDAANDRVWASDVIEDTLFEVSLADGTRTIKSSDTIPDAVLPFQSPRELIVNPNDANELLIVDQTDGIKGVNVVTGARRVYFENGISNDFGALTGIVLDSANNRILAADSDSESRVIAISLDDQTQSTLTSATIPNSAFPTFSNDFIRTLVLDPTRNRVLANDELQAALIAVDLDTGVRSMFSDPTTPDGVNAPVQTEEVFYDGTFEYAFWLDGNLDAVLAVDIVTGERVFVTRGDSVEVE